MKLGLTFAAVVSATFALLAGALAQEFPFERELLLDVAPLRGSKRVPGLEVSANGQATIDLWCKSGRGQVVLAADTITILVGELTAARCSPEQSRADEEMLAALNEITNWRREGDILVLVGPTPLRFRAGTN